MRYHSNFILFIIHFSLLQAEDYHMNQFYEKLFKSMNRSKFLPISSTSLSTEIKQSALSSSPMFNEQSYFNTRMERPIRVISTFSRLKRYDHSGIGTNRHISCDQPHQKPCYKQPSYGCCPHRTQYAEVNDYLKTSFINLSELAPIGLLIIVAMCIGLRFYYLCYEDPETIRPFIPAINNRPPIISSRTLSQSSRLASHLQATRERRENFNLETQETQSLSMSAPLRSSIALTEHQVPRNDHCGTRVAITSSVEQTSIQPPPAYEDLIRRDSIALTLEQESLLPPPTYEDFMWGNNEKEI